MSFTVCTAMLHLRSHTRRGKRIFLCSSVFRACHSNPPGCLIRIFCFNIPQNFGPLRHQHFDRSSPRCSSAQPHSFLYKAPKSGLNHKSPAQPTNVGVNSGGQESSFAFWWGIVPLQQEQERGVQTRIPGKNQMQPIIWTHNFWVKLLESLLILKKTSVV